MPVINVGIKSRRSDDKKVVSGIEPHEYSALKGAESPFQDQIKNILLKLENTDVKTCERLDLIEQEIYEMQMTMRLAFDSIKAGKLPILCAEDKRHAVVDKDGIVVDILIAWSPASSYIPSLKCYAVECPDNVGIGHFYKSKKFYSPNVWNRILIKIGIIK